MRNMYQKWLRVNGVIYVDKTDRNSGRKGRKSKRPC